VSRIDAGATPLERENAMIAPASSLPTSVDSVDLQIAAERP
jgi:hypothetical protein